MAASLPFSASAGILASVCMIGASRLSAKPVNDVGTSSGSSAILEDGLRYRDIRTLAIEGQAWSDVEGPFDRLPARAKSLVRPRVWELSKNPAGLCVRFVSDAAAIHARWTVANEALAMNHMPATGVSGLDLYVRDANGSWKWLAVGVPEGRTTAVCLTSGLAGGKREYLLYLPLYNGLASAEIAVPPGAFLEAAPPRSPERSKPLVFYGTSITQGGCASRPGMCHAAILGRRLDRPVVNLGFSSNGTMDPEMADLLSELDPAVYIIDCLPNMTPAMVSQRAEAFVKRIRTAHGTTPILMVEDRTFADAFLLPAKQHEHAALRAALRQAFDSLTAHGDANLAYLTGDKLLGADGEDTVDGSHPTDLGFVRQADAFEPVLGRLLQRQHP